jgi:drug/metabolite transporter (DMT)-like permease
VPPLAGALLAVVFWGISFVATKAVVAEISPFALILVRTTLGTAFLLVVLAIRRVPVLPPRSAWPTIALMGFVGVAFHQLLQAYALTLTSAVNTGWLIGLTPVWSALLAWLWLGERMSALKIAGLALGFVGAAVVVTGGKLSGGLLALPSTRGDLLILLSTLNWALYSVLGRKTLLSLGSTRATAGAFLAGLMLLAPTAFIGEGLGALGRLSLSGWAAVLFLGVCCSGLGYLFWYRALETMEASRVGALLYLEPLVTLAASMALLGERIGVATIAGGLLLLAGVAIVQRAR